MAVTFFLDVSMDLWLRMVGFGVDSARAESGRVGEKSQRRAVPSLEPVASTSRFFGFQARQATWSISKDRYHIDRCGLTESRCSIH